MVEQLRQDKPHSARIYDWFLGGKDNYEVDQRAGREVLDVFPDAPEMARTNRAFMRRATAYLAAERGIRQFLDIGTGIPTEPNLHQVAQEIAPETRVVYVDNDPLVLSHARALMASTPRGRTAYIDADACRTEDILTAPALRETLDMTQPVAVSLIALLHFLPDDCEPYEIVRKLRDAVAPGSFLVISQATADFAPAKVAAAVEVYRRSGLRPQVRSRAEFSRFFEGWELVEPGIVPPHRWRPAGIEPPAGADERVSFLAGLARKN